jgi:hypothetical protein
MKNQNRLGNVEYVVCRELEIQMDASIAFTMSAGTMPLSSPLALAKKLALNAPIMCVLFLISVLFTNAFGDL